MNAGKMECNIQTTCDCAHGSERGIACSSWYYVRRHDMKRRQSPSIFCSTADCYLDGEACFTYRHVVAVAGTLDEKHVVCVWAHVLLRRSQMSWVASDDTFFQATVALDPDSPAPARSGPNFASQLCLLHPCCSRCNTKICWTQNEHKCLRTAAAPAVARHARFELQTPPQ